MASSVPPAKLRDAFLIDLEQVWTGFRQNYPSESPYLFVLYGTEDIPQLTPHILTEESLTSAALKYLDRADAELLDETRKDLRFSVPDSPRFGEYLSGLPHVDKVFSEHAEELGEQAGYRILAKAAIAAFRKLDSRQLFGTGQVRDNLLLMVNTEACQFDWSRPSVKQLNSPAAVDRFESLTRRGPHSSSGWVAISEDGQFVFSSNNRDTNSNNSWRENSSINELVCYRFDDLRLTRHWEFVFPTFGDSICSGAVEPNRETFVVARCRYENHDATTILMRFGPNSNKPLAQRTYAGGVGSFAMSDNGQLIAVGQHDKSLLIFDQGFNLLRKFRMRASAQSLHFLKNGELIYTTSNHLLGLDPDTGQLVSRRSARCFRTSLGGNGQFLAVSRWFPKQVLGREKRPFGFKVLTLPDYKIYRRFFLRRRALFDAVISPDGRFVVCASNRVRGFRTTAVAFDLATGQFLGEFQCFPGHFAFLPDSRAVLVAGSVFGGEPVKTWQIPAAK